MKQHAVAILLSLLCVASPAGARSGKPPPQPKPNSESAVPVVLNARIGEHGDHTRFVVEMSDPVTLRVFTLANPNRLVIDMPEVLWRLQAPDRPSGKGR